jgi:hypothetical protein
LAELHEVMERLDLLARQGADVDVREAVFAALAPIAVEEERAVAS